MKKVCVLFVSIIILPLSAEENFRDWKRKRDRLIQRSHAEDRHLRRSKDELYYAKQDFERSKDINDYPKYWELENYYYQDQDHVFDDEEEEARLKEEIQDF